MIVGRAGGMGELADGGRFFISEARRISGAVIDAGEAGEGFEPVGMKGMRYQTPLPL